MTSAVEQLADRAAQLADRRDKQRQEDESVYARVILAEIGLLGGESLPVTKLESLLGRLEISPEKFSADVGAVRQRESLKAQEAQCREKSREHQESVPHWQQERRELQERLAKLEELLRAGQWISSDTVHASRACRELKQTNAWLFEILERIENETKGGES